MKKTIRVPGILLSLALVIFLPKTSFAWGDQQDHRDRGRAQHQYGDHRHYNPDLTLVSGMEDIDSKVLVAADPSPVVTDQPVEVIEVSAPPAPIINSDGDIYIVNVPNNAGGYTPVRIQQWGNAYLGPQGELYYPFPQISQLKAIYGV